MDIVSYKKLAMTNFEQGPDRHSTRDVSTNGCACVHSGKLGRRMHAGMHTPWGIAHTQEQLDDGVLWVETLHHGGLLIDKEQAPNILSAKALNFGASWECFFAFEQDHAMMVVLYEHPEFYFWVEEELTRKLAEDQIRQHNPDYFT